MGIEQIATVTISATQPGITQAGFGVPLIVSHTASWVERVRTYSALVGGVDADFAANTPEYLAAAKLFSQSPAPSSVKIGRAANKPTLKVTLKPLNVANSTDYKVRVRVGGTTVEETKTGTSDSSATNEEIVDALVTAINTTTSKNFTAAKTGTGSNAVVDITATNPGDWFAVEPLDLNLLTATTTHADPGIATDLAAIALADSSWYEFNTLYNSYALVLAAAAWAEANEKIYVAATADTLAATSAYDNATTTDIASKVRAAGYARTAVIFHPAADDFAGVAEAGRFLPLAPGSETWRLKTLAGVTAKTYTGTHITNLETKNTAYYYSLGGVSVVGGKGMVGTGEYIDVVRFRDWWKSRVQTDLANLLIQNNKIPFTDSGIAVVEAAIRAVNKEGIAAGGIAESPAPNVTFPKASAVSAPNKAARKLSPGSVTFTLAGAIHSIDVTATISL